MKLCKLGCGQCMGYDIILLGGKIMKKINNKTIINLDSEKPFEYDVVKAINGLINDKYLFYHIEVTDKGFSIEKQGYNTPAIESIEFDTTQLIDDESLQQTRDAIVSAYQYTFAKTGDLERRLSVIDRQPLADSHIGSSHAFYHDRTGKYGESDIVDRIKFLHQTEALENKSQKAR